MKKVMCAIAAVSAGICLADITSANIVGYNTCSEMQASASENMFNLMAIPFENTNGKGVSLNDLKFSNPTANARFANADQIQLWVKNESTGVYGYEIWFLKSTGWFAVSGGASFDETYKDGLPAGTAFWYRSAKKTGGVAGNLTSAGAVVGDDIVKRTIVRDDFNFVSYPYPVPLMLNDAEMVDWGECVANARFANADQIQLWVKNEATGVYVYEIYYKTSSGWKAVSGGNLFEVNHPNGVSVGTGFWYKAKAKSGSESFDITFKSPLAKAAE